MYFNNKLIIISLLFICVFVPIVMAGSASAKTIYVKDVSYYTGTSLNSQIQSLLDAAESGDTIEFMGLAYENLQLLVTTQLNLVSTSGTMITSSSGTAVFLINGPEASGTQISGFTINTNGSSGIYVNNTNNTVISDNQINSTSGSAVKVEKSSNTVIEDNNLTDSATGVEVDNSKNTQITGNNITHNQDGVTLENTVNTTIDNNNISDNTENGVEVKQSDKTAINHSTIKDNGNNGVVVSSSNRTIVDNSTVKGNGNTAKGNGLSVESSDKVLISNCHIETNYDGINTKDVSDLIIVYNYILNNDNDGLVLSGFVRDVQIVDNTIQGNLYGIKLDSDTDNLNLTGNIITDQKSSKSDPVSGAGISFESHYIQKDTNVIEHNAVYSNGGKDIDARNSNPIYDQYNQIAIGSNWYGTNDQSSVNICCCVKSTATQMKIIRTGYDTYTVIFVDGDTGEIESDLSSLLVRISKGNSQQVQYTRTENGVASGKLVGDKNSVAYVVASAGKQLVSGSWNMEISQITNKFSKISSVNYWDWNAASGGNDEDGSGNTQGSGAGDSGAGDSGANSGTATSSGSSSSTSSSGVSSGSQALGTTAAASAAGASSSSGSSDGGGDGDQDSKTVQELIVDELNQNSQFWGIIAIIMLIIVVIGAHYRNDIRVMIENSKK